MHGRRSAQDKRLAKTTGSGRADCIEESGQGIHINGKKHKEHNAVTERCLSHLRELYREISSCPDESMPQLLRSLFKERGKAENSKKRDSSALLRQLLRHDANFDIDESLDLQQVRSEDWKAQQAKHGRPEEEESEG